MNHRDELDEQSRRLAYECAALTGLCASLKGTQKTFAGPSDAFISCVADTAKRYADEMIRNKK